MKNLSIGRAMMIAASLSVATAEAQPDSREDKVQRFNQSVQQLADKLTIDGIAYAVVRNGATVATGEIKSKDSSSSLTVDTPLRFASVTKAVTAISLMAHQENEQLALDQPVVKFLPESGLPEKVTIRHLAAHVSEGELGSEYVYGTNRYAKLQAVLEKASGNGDFESVLRKTVLKPAGMRWFDSPSLGAHAGLVSTVSEMAKFAAALQTEQLISKASFDEMGQPYILTGGRHGPVGVGWFSQQIGAHRLVWSFGQDDPDHSSSLILLLPGRNLALVMLANTDELSNPYRLLMGDVRYSAFAQAFLGAFAPDVAGQIPEYIRVSTATLTAGFSGDFESALKNFQVLVSDLPEAFSNPENLVLHFLATGLKGATAEKHQLVDLLDEKAVAAHPANRWVLLGSAEYRKSIGETDTAKQRYQAILGLPNQEKDFLWRLFRAWCYRDLAIMERPHDSDVALEYIEDGLATQVRGETREQLLGLKDAIEHERGQ